MAEIGRDVPASEMFTASIGFVSVIKHTRSAEAHCYHAPRGPPASIDTDVDLVTRSARVRFINIYASTSEGNMSESFPHS